MRDSAPEPNQAPLPTAAQPWSVEQDAEQLMDDLFANVDVLLEGSSQLPCQPVQPAERQENPIAVPVKATTVATAAIPPRKTQRTLRTRPSRQKTRRKKMQGTTAAAQSVFPWATRLQAWRTRLWVHLDKVCFGIACVSLGGAVVGLVQQHQVTFSLMAASGSRPLETNAVVPPLSAEDAQFTQYMLRSLRVIDQQAPQTTPRLARAAQAVASNDETVATASPQVIERIYIPVYAPQTPTPAASSTASSTVNSAGTLSPTAAQSEATPAPPSAPAPLAPEPATRRSEPSLPNPDSLAALESVAPVPLPSDGVHSFAGFIQAGDRTTALFTVDGKTQRVGPGEAIGSSGWTLVSANDQTAMIRRNGQVHTITRGQRF